MISIRIIKGRVKCKEKKRFSVALLIENPPQSQLRRRVPRKGIVVVRFVITVAPQYDIWPQGRTYPRKAVAMDIK